MILENFTGLAIGELLQQYFTRVRIGEGCYKWVEAANTATCKRVSLMILSVHDTEMGTETGKEKKKLSGELKWWGGVEGGRR
jgi:hypothetical protein